MTETPDRDPLTDPDETAPAPVPPGNETDPYELRSMPAEPNGNEDDPGSYLNP